MNALKRALKFISKAILMGFAARAGARFILGMKDQDDTKRRDR